MKLEIIFSFLFALIVFVLLFSYWFFPREVQFGVLESKNSDFSLNTSLNDSMQFYENLRYRNFLISYKIENCSIGKKDEMKRAFLWVENKTILKFYEVNENEEISVSCEDTFINGEKGAFVAGEGGVTNVTQTENFNVIFNGKIILIRETKCKDPFVGTHELLHALGFDHSDNPSNIMYSSVNCRQIFSEDIISKINNLYSYKSLPDLSFENASALMKGRYLDLEVVLINNGLKDSESSTLIITANEKPIREIDIESIQIGGGRKIILKNLLVLNPKINEIGFSISHNGDELNKNNNKIYLEIKKEIISSD